MTTSIPRRRAMAAAALLAFGASALAQDAWPSKPVRMIVPFAPGGSTDVVARAMLPSLEKRLGQPVVIENRGGAGGNIGVEAVAPNMPAVVVPPDALRLFEN